MKGEGLKRLAEMMRQLGRKPFVKVGVLGDVQRRQEKGDAIDNVGLAVVHEYGLPHRGIPARPFLRGTFDTKKAAWDKLLERMAPLVLQQKLTVEAALALLGERAAADVKAYVTHGSALAPNKPATIARKGSSRPLIDSAQLINSVSYRVEG
jgi:hypothetical protein